MSTWSDPLGDLRRFLADSDDDNLVKQRAVLPTVTNGQTRKFLTFDDRILASGNQSVCAKPLRVFWGSEEIAASGILVLDQNRGEFEMMFVPSGNLNRLTATYYFQKWNDDELNSFLAQGGYQVNADILANVIPALRLPAMEFAASMAFTRLASRWQQRKSQQFLLEDEPARKEAEELINYCTSEAKRLQEAGREDRKAYYETKLDQARSPAYGTLVRMPWPYTPRR